MSDEATKGVRELKVLARFLGLARLPVDQASIEKRPPGEPDILCELAGERVAFELVEICDPALAQFIATAKPDDGRVLRTSDPSQVILAKKLLRHYQPGCPLELLCFVDGGVITPDSTLVPILKKILGESEHGYRRVWLLGHNGLFVVHEAG